MHSKQITSAALCICFLFVAKTFSDVIFLEQEKDIHISHYYNAGSDIDVEFSSSGISVNQYSSIGIENVQSITYSNYTMAFEVESEVDLSIGITSDWPFGHVSNIALYLLDENNETIHNFLDYGHFL